MALNNVITPMSKTFSGKRDLVAGNTGFKGSSMYRYSKLGKAKPLGFEQLKIKLGTKQTLSIYKTVSPLVKGS